MSSTPTKSAEDTQKPSGHMGNRDEFKHPSRMVKRPGPLLRWLGSAFFKDVRFDDTAVNTIREASDGHVPVFVLTLTAFWITCFLISRFCDLHCP